MADLTSFTIELWKRLDGWISPQFDSLEKRLTTLEKSTKNTLADSYKGTFDAEAHYERGDTLTHSGSLWLAMTRTKAKPGHTPDWRLIVKRGDAR